LCWSKDNIEGKKEQTLCLYNCVPAKSWSICYAMNVIYGPPAECNTRGRAECYTLLHSACTRVNPSLEVMGYDRSRDPYLAKKIILIYETLKLNY
jgi:hypothetical protein